MTTIIGVDPGPVKSGIVRLDESGPVGNVMENTALRKLLSQHKTHSTLAIEVMESQGDKRVPKIAFDTCIEAGRFIEAFGDDDRVLRVTRREVKLHLLGRTHGDDAAIWRVLKDIYGGDDAIKGPRKCQGCNGKGWRGRGRPTCEDCGGTGKGAPAGPLYGLTGNGGHAQAALAVALTASARVGAVYSAADSAAYGSRGESS